MRKLAVLLYLFIVYTMTLQAQLPTGGDPKMKPFIDGLIRQMTLDEKIGQLNLLTSDMDVTGPTIRAGYKQDILSGKCGNIFNAYSPNMSRSCRTSRCRRG